jgi:hypothetical protein
VARISVKEVEVMANSDYEREMDIGSTAKSHPLALPCAV